MKFVDVAESVQNYLFNRPMTGDKDPDARFKLAPTPEDKKLFQEIIELGWDALPKTTRIFFTRMAI